MIPRRMTCQVLLSSILAALAPPLLAESAPDVVWSKILGEDHKDDYAHGLAVDGAGNVVIVGETRGALFRPTPFYYDGYYVSYDHQGNLRWGHQLGKRLSLLKFNDVVSLDSGAWSVIGTANYSAGAPLGINTTHHGATDAVLVGLTADGSVDWMTQVGTASNDTGQAVADHLTAVGYAGDTYGSFSGSNAGGNDVFVGRFHNPAYLPPGSHTNGGQFGTDDWDFVSDMDAGFVAGTTYGSFNGGSNNSTDAFLTRFDIDGVPMWTRQYGNSQPAGGHAVVADGSGAVYLAGFAYVHGRYSAGDGPDGFLAKYDYAGNLQWERFLTSDANTPLGLAKSDEYSALALDAWGNVFVAGHRHEELTTPSSSPAVVAKYSPAGELLWTNELQFNATHRVSGLAVDPSGTRIWVAGNATGPGTFGEDNTSDVFLAYLESPYLAGDFNLDSRVDGSDFLAWQRSGIESAASHSLLSLWKANYGRIQPDASSVAGPVPEPGTASLLIVALGGYWLRERAVLIDRW